MINGNRAEKNQNEKKNNINLNPPISAPQASPLEG